MAKKNIQSDILQQSIKGMLQYSTVTKPRNFTETVEIHFGLKNFDPARDRRIAGNTQLPHPPKVSFKVCVFGNEKHIDEAKENKMDYKSLEDLKKINKDKKIVKKIGKSYDQLLASSNIIKQVPRLLGPTLNRIGKFPMPLKPNEKIEDKIKGLRNTVSFQLKFKTNGPMCLSAPVGHIDMTPKELEENITAAVNFVLTLMKKGWQNVKKIHVKTTMGPGFTIYGF